MIHWTVSENILTSGDEKLNTSTIDYLIGKRINWSIRNYKIVSLGKRKNRLALFDSEFIPGCKYKHQGHNIFQCISVDSECNAILTRTFGAELRTVVSSNPYDWEIIE